jgi:hypothetical protein
MFSDVIPGFLTDLQLKIEDQTRPYWYTAGGRTRLLLGVVLQDPSRAMSVCKGFNVHGGRYLITN